MPQRSKYGSPIAYQRAFAGVTGSITAAVMLSQAAYWSAKTKDPEGWFWKTQDEWHEETGMTRYEQEGARKTLRKFDFWLEELRGIPAKMFFRVKEDDLDDAVERWIEDKELADDVESSVKIVKRKHKSTGQI